MNFNAQPRILKPIWEIVGAKPEDRARVVTVFGPPRVGKSTMLNALGRKIDAPDGVGPPDSRKWFGESAGVHSFTKGVHVAPWRDRGVVWLDCEGKGDAGAKLDTSLMLPLYVLSRVSVWTIRTVGRDDVLRSVDDVMVAAEQLMLRMEVDADEQGSATSGGDSDEEEDEEEQLRNATRNIFGHLVIVMRDCGLDGDLEELFLASEPVELDGWGRPLTEADRARLERNGRRDTIKHCFESVQVIKMPAPSDCRAPMEDEAFAGSMDKLLDTVQELARQPPEPGPQSLQRPPQAGGGGAADATAAGAAAASTVVAPDCTFQWLQDVASHLVGAIRDGGVPSPAGLRGEIEQQQAARRREAELQEACDHMRARGERRELEFQQRAAEWEQQAEATRREAEQLAQQMEEEMAGLKAEGQATSEGLQRMGAELASRKELAKQQDEQARAARRQHEEAIRGFNEELRAKEREAGAQREEMRRRQEENQRKHKEMQEQIRVLANRPVIVKVKRSWCALM